MEKLPKISKSTNGTKSSARLTKMTSRERVKRVYAPMDGSQGGRVLAGGHMVMPKKKAKVVGSKFDLRNLNICGNTTNDNSTTNANRTTTTNANRRTTTTRDCNNNITTNNTTHHGQVVNHNAPVNHVTYNIYGNNGAISQTMDERSNEPSLFGKANRSFEETAVNRLNGRKKKLRRIMTAARIRPVSREHTFVPLCTYKTNIEYGTSILNKMMEKEQVNHAARPLANHNVTARLRSRMIDWMIECLHVYSKGNESFFTSAYMFDNFLNRTDTIIEDDLIHLLGMCCIFLASKYADVMPMSLMEISKKIGYGEYSSKKIKKTEVMILDSCNWKVNFATPLHFIKFIFLLMENSIKSESFKPLYDSLKKHAIQYSRMSLINEDLLEFKPSEIAMG